MKTAPLTDERGWALVTAVILMAVMLSIGLAAVGLLDSDTRRTGDSRRAESAFNLDEGVLYAQSLVLAKNWPSADSPAPVVCSSDTAPIDARCPVPANLAGTGAAANFNNVDQLADSTWKTKVRDNGGDLTVSYDPLKADNPQLGCAGTPCTWDFNGDKRLWVQAQSIVRGRPRNIVALLQLEEFADKPAPSAAAITAGRMRITNNGNAVPLIDTSGANPGVIVRCSTSEPDCAKHRTGQIEPQQAPVTNNAPALMTPAQLQQYKARAIADGRYFPGCPIKTGTPAKYDLSGEVVWVEGCTAPPVLNNEVKTSACTPPENMQPLCANDPQNPGLLIWHCGLAHFQGAYTYRGVLYHVNNSDGTCPPSLPQRSGGCTKDDAIESGDALVMWGGFGVWGAVAVDGPGCLKIGSNGMQVKYDQTAVNELFPSTYSTSVGLVQNSWRELRSTAF